jgi:hypothetical protein
MIAGVKRASLFFSNGEAKKKVCNVADDDDGTDGRPFTVAAKRTHKNEEKI